MCEDVSNTSSDFLADFMAPSTSSPADEFETCLLMPTPNNSSDILQLWNEHKTRLPVMADIAKQLLSVQATSTSSERVFSVCGAVFTERRCRVTAANLEKLVFLKYNMQLHCKTSGELSISSYVMS